MVITQPSCNEVEIKYFTSLSRKEPSYDHIYLSEINIKETDFDNFHGQYIWSILTDHLLFIDTEVYNKNDEQNKVILNSSNELRKQTDGSIEETYFANDSRELTKPFKETTHYQKLR